MSTEAETNQYFKLQVGENEFNFTSKTGEAFMYSDTSKFPAKVQDFYTIKEFETIILVEPLILKYLNLSNIIET